jgi:hypothetical protein
MLLSRKIIACAYTMPFVASVAELASEFNRGGPVRFNNELSIDLSLDPLVRRDYQIFRRQKGFFGDIYVATVATDIPNVSATLLSALNGLEDRAPGHIALSWMTQIDYRGLLSAAHDRQGSHPRIPLYLNLQALLHESRDSVYTIQMAMLSKTSYWNKLMMSSDIEFIKNIVDLESLSSRFHMAGHVLIDYVLSRFDIGTKATFGIAHQSSLKSIQERREFNRNPIGRSLELMGWDLLAVDDEEYTVEKHRLDRPRVRWEPIY